MKNVKLDDFLGNEKELIDSIVNVLRNDGIIVLPSDTCYGISCIYNSSVAKRKIAEFKNQSVEKPMTILISNLNQLYELVEVSSLAAELIEEFWPGPLTLILPAKDSDEYLAIRFPDHSLSKSIIDKLESPICSTSANKHGSKESYHLDELKMQYNNDLSGIDLIIDDEMLDFNIPSTILKIVDDKLELIREGKLWTVIANRF